MVRRMMVNLALLIGIVFPICLLTLGFDSYLREGVAGAGDVFGGMLFFFVLMAPRLFIAGVGQQILLLIILPTWPNPWRRVVAVLSTAVIFPWAALVGEPRGLILGLLIYGLVLRLPRAR